MASHNPPQAHEQATQAPRTPFQQNAPLAMPPYRDQFAQAQAAQVQYLIQASRTPSLWIGCMFGCVISPDAIIRAIYSAEGRLVINLPYCAVCGAHYPNGIASWGAAQNRGPNVAPVRQQLQFAFDHPVDHRNVPGIIFNLNAARNRELQHGGQTGGQGTGATTCSQTSQSSSRNHEESQMSGEERGDGSFPLNTGADAVSHLTSNASGNRNESQMEAGGRGNVFTSDAFGGNGAFQAPWTQSGARPLFHPEASARAVDAGRAPGFAEGNASGSGSDGAGFAAGRGAFAGVRPLYEPFFGPGPSAGNYGAGGARPSFGSGASPEVDDADETDDYSTLDDAEAASTPRPTGTKRPGAMQLSQGSVASRSTPVPHPEKRKKIHTEKSTSTQRPSMSVRVRHERGQIRMRMTEAELRAVRQHYDLIPSPSFAQPGSGEKRAIILTIAEESAVYDLRMANGGVGRMTKFEDRCKKHDADWKASGIRNSQKEESRIQARLASAGFVLSAEGLEGDNVKEDEDMTSIEDDIVEQDMDMP